LAVQYLKNALRSRGMGRCTGMVAPIVDPCLPTSAPGRCSGAVLATSSQECTNSMTCLLPQLPMGGVAYLHMYQYVEQWFARSAGRCSFGSCAVAGLCMRGARHSGFVAGQLPEIHRQLPTPASVMSITGRGCSPVVRSGVRCTGTDRPLMESIMWEWTSIS
jgi:hypothetical protein